MPKAERSARLAALDLDQWHRRSPRSPAPAPVENAIAAEPVQVQAADPAVATALVDWPAAFSLSDEAGGLLLKILAATGHAPERFAIFQVTDTPPPVAGEMLWFTQRAVAPADHITLLPSLQSMLSQPALKRVAWSGLKQWMARMGAGR
ncbi:MAG: hypothetical protein AAGA23_14900 [Pseudomonadota bacterium]